MDGCSSSGQSAAGGGGGGELVSIDPLKLAAKPGNLVLLLELFIKISSGITMRNNCS